MAQDVKPVKALMFSYTHPINFGRSNTAIPTNSPLWLKILYKALLLIIGFDPNRLTLVILPLQLWNVGTSRNMLLFWPTCISFNKATKF